MERVNLDERLAPAAARAAADPSQALAAVEMHAAGILRADAGPAEISVMFQELLKSWPESPLIHQRYGEYLLTRVQQTARTSPGQRISALPEEAPSRLDALDAVREARWELLRASAIDPQNSAIYYDIAYSYAVLEDYARAAEWMQKGLMAPEYDAGDDVVMSGTARLLTGAGVPSLEGLIALYRVAEFAPSYAEGRSAALASVLLNDRPEDAGQFKRGEYASRLAAFEDMGEKLFQTADVVRQTQASFITSGILWRRVMRQADERDDKAVASMARRQLATTSYRYLLIGWERAGAGLMPQQSVIDLDTPHDLRLPFSETAQRFAQAFLMALATFLLAALVTGAFSIRWKAMRQPALALVVLAVFAGLGYSASFYSTIGERARAERGFGTRLKVIHEAPDFTRKNGQPEAPADIRIDIPKAMLYTFDYTLEAGRVLAWVGTRESYDALIESLSRADNPRPAEVLVALKEATGMDFGIDAGASKDAETQAIARWQEWWRANRGSFPEAAATATDPSSDDASRGA